MESTSMQWHVASIGTCVDRTAAAMLYSIAVVHAPQRFGHLSITDLACKISTLSKEMAGTQQCRPGEANVVGNVLPRDTHMQDSRRLI